MTIGPILIRWKQDVEQEQAQAQRHDMRQNRVIAGLTKDNEAMRHVLKRIRDGVASRTGKTPSRVGQTV